MAIRISAIRGIALRLAALATLSVGSMSAQAAVILVDPGEVGGPSNSPLVAGITVEDPVGAPLSFTFELTDMRHVEATRWGFEATSDPNLPFSTYLYMFFLTDEFGNEITGTARDGALNLHGSNPDFVEFVDPQGPTFIAHGIQFGFDNVFTDFGFVFSVFVEGQVGEWTPVPEPSTLTLFGAGLLGLVLLARRRRKAA